MERTYKRGDMYYADLGKGIGSEQEGYRPVLIIQNNIGNRHSTTVIVTSILSRVDVKPKLPAHYFIDAECGLQLPSIVLLEQLRTVSKQRLEGYIGRLDKKHIRGVNHALTVSIGLISPPFQTGFSSAYAALVRIIFTARGLTSCKGLTKGRPRKTSAHTATSGWALIMKSSRKQTGGNDSQERWEEWHGNNSRKGTRHPQRGLQRCRLFSASEGNL